ncbi:superoxide dismutase family protein [Erythrobacter crassostreae]|uniref:Superoxide dismutase family protein n=1 Tax=Erythrobacter crassostreae TaxID=2828328 RepID=A0A9X1JJZ6_9SPHN|nr:superoxide dismutase family protein [Erythrobacter crassostrea]MBV7258401.1 superoxide dismutase family protein [Erythrobacter crassostrea]
MRLTSSLGLVAFAISGCTSGTEPAQEAEKPIENEASVIASASMISAKGDARGTVEFKQSGDVLTLQISLSGIEPGAKAFHLHTTGKCDAPDFKTAGGHLNPFAKTHGRLSEQGSHLGDFENIEISDNGTALATRMIEKNAAEIESILFDEDGTAVMIHAGPDDYMSDPAGAAGPRIACGIVERAP